MDDNLFDDLPFNDTAAGAGTPAAGSVSSRLPWRYAGPGRVRFPMVASGGAARRAAKAGAGGGKNRRGPDVDDHIRHAVREESAATLGRAGTVLQEAVAALSDFDRGHAGGDGTRGAAGAAGASGASGVSGAPGGAAERRALVVAAAAALWQYVVQREAMGLTNHDALEHVYGVTRELWSLMGSAEVVCRKGGQ
jgi:hypothetical protein